MCVLVGWCAVGCPTGVTDADVSDWQRVVGDLRFEIAQLAGFLAGLELSVCDNRNSGGVVAAVFEAAKATDENVNG